MSLPAHHTIPATMKAVVFEQSLEIHAPNALFDSQLPTPSPQGQDLLIKVAAIAVNPVDCKVRKRALPEKGPAKILGWDAVGTVVACGDNTSLFNVGDEVYYAGDVTRDGCYAEYQLVDERIVGTKPSNLTSAEAAAVPLTSITAYEMLFDRLQINADKTEQPILLITGAAGGVGSMMTQLAKALSNAQVIATASRAESQAWVKELGADIIIDHGQPIIEQLAQQGIKPHSITHIASLTHTDRYFDDFIELIAPQGKICLIDDPTEPLNFMALKAKSVSLIWELMFTRSRFQTHDMISQHHMLNKMARLFEDGTLKSTVKQSTGCINGANLIKAHALIESQTMIGKLVLEGF